MGSQDSDFSTLKGYLNFNKGETVKQIPLETYDDKIAEPVEKYFIQLIDVIDEAPKRDQAIINQKNKSAILTSK